MDGKDGNELPGVSSHRQPPEPLLDEREGSVETKMTGHCQGVPPIEGQKIRHQAEVLMFKQVDCILEPVSPLL